MKYRRRIAYITAIVAGILIVAGLAGVAISKWGGELLSVDPRAIRQVESIGQVAGLVETRFTESDSIVVTQHLIVEVEGSDSSSAVLRAKAALEQKGWGSVGSSGIQMESNEWNGVLLTLEAPQSTSGAADREVSKALEYAKTHSKDPDSLVLIRLRRTDF